MPTQPVEATTTFHQDVEEFFLAKRGRTQLSNLDFPVIDEWFHKGVPLELVKRVIEQLLQSNPTVGNLRYFRPAIEREMERRAEMHAGGRPSLTVVPPVPVPDALADYKQQVTEHLQRCLSQIEAAWPRLQGPALAVEAVAWQLMCAIDAVSKSDHVDEALETELEAMEDQLGEAVVATIGPARCREFQDQVENEPRMERFKPRVSADLYNQQLRRAVKNVLFEHFGLPRLSLFFMEK